mmetsp:Transcript_27760/g.40878  ORF Transcript_27760/g.40878 Transcript_27760/m.40878 type:complete len:113 (+) Transcript_27760:2032-2370(+)
MITILDTFQARYLVDCSRSHHENSSSCNLALFLLQLLSVAFPVFSTFANASASEKVTSQTPSLIPRTTQRFVHQQSQTPFRCLRFIFNAKHLSNDGFLPSWIPLPYFNMIDV